MNAIDRVLLKVVCLTFTISILCLVFMVFAKLYEHTQAPWLFVLLVPMAPFLTSVTLISMVYFFVDSSLIFEDNS